jgi:chromosome segregation ATPase
MKYLKVSTGSSLPVEKRGIGERKGNSPLVQMKPNSRKKVEILEIRPVFNYKKRCESLCEIIKQNEFALAASEATLKQEVSNKQYFIEQMNIYKKECAEKDIEIKQLKSSASNKSAIEKDAQISGLQDTNHALIREKSEKDERIKGYKQQIKIEQERADRIESEKDKEISDMQKEIYDLNKSHDFFIENWKKKVQEKDKEIADLNEKFSKEYRETFNYYGYTKKLDGMIIGLKKQLAEKDKIITDYQESLRKSNKELTKKADEIAEKDKFIEKLNEENLRISLASDGKDKEIIKLNEEILKKDDLIVKVAEKDIHIHNLEESLEMLKKERDAVTKGLIEDNQKLALEVDSLKKELNFNSRNFWKAAAERLKKEGK